MRFSKSLSPLFICVLLFTTSPLRARTTELPDEIWQKLILKKLDHQTAAKLGIAKKKLAVLVVEEDLDWKKQVFQLLPSAQFPYQFSIRSWRALAAGIEGLIANLERRQFNPNAWLPALMTAFNPRGHLIRFINYLDHTRENQMALAAARTKRDEKMLLALMKQAQAIEKDYQEFRNLPNSYDLIYGKGVWAEVAEEERLEVLKTLAEEAPLSYYFPYSSIITIVSGRLPLKAELLLHQLVFLTKLRRRGFDHRAEDTITGLLMKLIHNLPNHSSESQLGFLYTLYKAGFVVEIKPIVDSLVGIPSARQSSLTRKLLEYFSSQHALQQVVTRGSYGEFLKEVWDEFKSHTLDSPEPTACPMTEVLSLGKDVGQRNISKEDRLALLEKQAEDDSAAREEYLSVLCDGGQGFSEDVDACFNRVQEAAGRRIKLAQLLYYQALQFGKLFNPLAEQDHPREINLSLEDRCRLAKIGYNEGIQEAEEAYLELMLYGVIPEAQPGERNLAEDVYHKASQGNSIAQCYSVRAILGNRWGYSLTNSEKYVKLLPLAIWGEHTACSGLYKTYKTKIAKKAAARKHYPLKKTDLWFLLKLLQFLQTGSMVPWKTESESNSY